MKGVTTTPAGSALIIAKPNGDTDNSPDPGTLVDRNERWTAGVFDPLTPSPNLVAEFSNVRARNHDGDDNTEDTVALGGVQFF